MANSILQDDLADAIVATIVAMYAHFPFIGRSAGNVRVEKGDQATKFSEGAEGRCLVKVLPSVPIDEDSDEESGSTNFRFELEFDGKDVKGAKLERSLVSQAIRSAFGDTGVAMLALLNDTGSNRLHGSGELVIASVIEDPNGAGPDRFKFTAELHFTCSHPVPFNYPPAPLLTAVTPASGAAAGGTPVTITGSYFIGATGVTFGGVAATAVTVVSVREITCTTPAHAAGAVSVLVTTPRGTNAANAAFTYV